LSNILRLLRRFSAASPGARYAAVFCLITVLSLAAYSNSFNADFHFDDNHQIVRNHYMRSMKNFTRFYTDAGTASYIGGYANGYRPVLLSSFMLSYQMSGGRPWSFHLVNFCIHIVNALLVFLAVSAVLKKTGEDGDLVAGAAALVFALHPVETAAVTYISGRSALLATFFYLAAFNLYIRAKGSSGPGPARILAVTFLYLVGLLSKEIAVSLPVVMIAYDLTVGRSAGAGIRSRWASYVAVCGVTLFFVWLKGHMQGYTAAPVKAYGTFEYLMSESKAMLLYLRLIVLPVNQNADYNIFPTVFPDGGVAVATAFFLSALFLIYKYARSEPAAVFFGLWGLIALAPESSFIPIIDIAVEHRLYLPSVGVLACAVILAGRVLPPGKAAVALACSLAMLGTLTFCRNEVWATELALWRDIVAKSPNSARGRMNLGTALMNDGKYEEALAELRTAMTHPDPRYGVNGIIFYNLGCCYKEMGRLDDAEKAFVESAKGGNYSIEDSMAAYSELGDMYFDNGRYKDAVRVFELVASRLKGDPKGTYNLGVAYMMTGRYADALERLTAVEKFYADSFDLHINLSRAYLKTGDPARAAVEAGMAARLASGPDQASEAEDALKAAGGRG